jgi:hypothetical protein
MLPTTPEGKYRTTTVDSCSASKSICHIYTFRSNLSVILLRAANPTEVARSKFRSTRASAKEGKIGDVCQGEIYNRHSNALRSEYCHVEFVPGLNLARFATYRRGLWDFELEKHY